MMKDQPNNDDANLLLIAAIFLSQAATPLHECNHMYNSNMEMMAEVSAGATATVLLTNICSKETTAPNATLG